MTMQVKKTYRGLNPELLYDEVRDLVSKRGLEAAQASIQTYSLSSGATQSRVTVSVHTSEGVDCGSLHIIGTANGDARMTLELDDKLVPTDTLDALKSDIDFMLGSYEVKW